MSFKDECAVLGKEHGLFPGPLQLTEFFKTVFKLFFLGNNLKMQSVGAYIYISATWFQYPCLHLWSCWQQAAQKKKVKIMHLTIQHTVKRSTYFSIYLNKKKESPSIYWFLLTLYIWHSWPNIINRLQLNSLSCFFSNVLIPLLHCSKAHNWKFKLKNKNIRNPKAELSASGFSIYFSSAQYISHPALHLPWPQAEWDWLPIQRGERWVYLEKCP